MRRNAGDERLRQLERAYQASPGDLSALDALLVGLTRTRGVQDAVTWIGAFWNSNELVPDHGDLDRLAEVVFRFTRFEHELRDGLKAVEAIALAADAAEIEDLDIDEADQDQRAPWWRRERFHDIDFDRTQPWKGGRLYSPAVGTFLTVTEVTRDRGEDKAPQRRGWLLVEAPIEDRVEGFDALLLDMAKGLGRHRREPRPISTWMLKRVLGEAAKSKAAVFSAPSTGRRPTLPYRDAIFVTYMREDPTDVVESITGAPAAPMGGAPHVYDSPGPVDGLWQGAGGRMSVIRGSGPDLQRRLADALWHWRIAKHPYRVRLSELRSRYHEERGHETLDLIWVGQDKARDDLDGEIITSWSNEQTDPELEEFEWGESIMDQLELDRFPRDWTEAAARNLHDVIVVEDWERTTMSTAELRDARREAAEEAYQDYDFGREVVDISGWEFEEPFGNEWTRPVFLENEAGGASIRVAFTVTFAPGSSEITDMSAGG